MKIVLASAAIVLLATAFGSPADAQAGPPTAAPAAAGRGAVVVVQAVPRARVDVSIDGRTLRRGARVGTLVGPVQLSAGSHELVFSGLAGGRDVRTRLQMSAGSNRDVVLHLPASVDGAPVVNTYRTPDKPIGPGKARVLLAHTATVAPADVELDGRVVFQDIANGEYAEADVPAGEHRVALLPSGSRGTPILGPLGVDLSARTATMAYAYGRPRDRSMNVIVHTVALAPDGSVVPRRVETGSAGLARTVVRTFSARPPALEDLVAGHGR